MIRRLMNFTSKEIIESDCNITITYDEAMRDSKVIGIGDSFITEWIDQLKNATTDEIKERFSIAKGNYTKGIKTRENKQIMIDCEFIPELIKVEFTSPKHFDKLKDGFICNGKRYVYFLSKGTSSVTYIYEGIAEDFKDRIDNGRNKEIEFIPAKLNAYFSLSASSSRKIYHQPKHVVVVRDNTTTFEATYLSVTTKGVEEVTEEVTLEASDGNGVIDYILLQLWSDDLGYNGKLSSGVSIRNSFMKGMVFPIDLQKFFTEHNVKEIVDVWGNTHLVEDVDMVIPTSMFKLWQSYSNYDEYDRNCKANGYEFRVCKESHEIKASRINYQFTTDLEMSQEQVERFIAPSIQHMKDICGGDWLSTVLYLNGQSLVESSANGINSIEGALMLAPELINDKIILDTTRQLTQKQRRELCIGRYWVDSNYQIVSSDLYNFLCSACGIESKGLLKANEVYSNWHVQRGHKEALLFRSPMIDEHNIARVKIADNEKLRDFFQYMTEIVVLNDWDCIADTLAGCDKDGDTVICSTDPVLLEVQKPTLPVRCEAVKGVKTKCGDKELMDACRLGLDDSKYNIGTCINHITNMFSKRSEFHKDSKEYKELSDRIILGLMISQGYIDFKKNGTVVMEMPKHWYSLKDCDNDFDRSICADKKPYFFRYNDEASSKLIEKESNYNKFVNMRALAHWGITGEELLAKPWKDLTDDQKQLLISQEKYNPYYSQDNSCQHLLCKATERALKDITHSNASIDLRHLYKFDNVQTDKVLQKRMVGLLQEFSSNRKSIFKSRYVADKDMVKYTNNALVDELKFDLKAKLMELGDFEVMFNTLVDTIYDEANVSSKLLWELFPDTIISNIKQHKGNKALIPVRDDENGLHEYLGIKYSIKEVELSK